MRKHTYLLKGEEIESPQITIRKRKYINKYKMERKILKKNSERSSFFSHKFTVEEIKYVTHK